MEENVADLEDSDAEDVPDADQVRFLKCKHVSYLFSQLAYSQVISSFAGEEGQKVSRGG